MKRFSIRCLAVTLIIFILCSLFTVSSLALTNDTQVIDVTWQKPSAIKAVEQREKEFLVSLSTEEGRINNLYFSFPNEGGVRMHLDNEGYFSPSACNDIEYSKDDLSIIMSAGGTTVLFYKDETPWRIEIRNSKNNNVLELNADDILLGYDENNELKKVKTVTPIVKNEVLFGLGERFNGFIQNGKTIEMWNYDSVKQLKVSYGDHNVGYKNIPMLHSNKGYSIFYNNTYYAIADVGESDETECSFEFYGPILDMYIWTDTTENNINSYLSLTGSTIIPPKWALSYWAGQIGSVWRNNTRSEEETLKNIQSVFEKYQAMGINIKNVYAEGCWYFDSVMKYFKDNDMHVFAWSDSTFRTHDNLENTTPAASVGNFASIDRNLYPCVRRLSNPLRYFRENGTTIWVDYTNPLSVDWLKARFKKPFSNGVQGMMVDYADNLDINTLFYNGATGDYMHNLYPLYYNKAMYEAFSSYWGEDYITFARAGCAGSQKYTAVFAGDQTSSFFGLEQVVSALLSSSTSGINIWGSDIGGYGTTSDKIRNDPELYARWLAFGTFSPLMRSHGSTSRDPWTYDENGASNKRFSFYYNTREALIDYIYSADIKASLENTSVVKPMVVAFQDTDRLAKNETQYLLGDDLLVCPVVKQGVSSLEVDFPDGRWVSLWNGAVYNTESAVVEADLDTIPVYVREGAALPITLSKTLEIGDSTTDGINAVLITPSSEKRTIKYYSSKDSVRTFTSQSKNENTYLLDVDAECDEKVIMIYGTTAQNVLLDGKTLNKLEKYPDGNNSQSGYYVDYKMNRTIVVTDTSWKSIEYSDTTNRVANLALNCDVTWQGDDSFGKTATFINDGKYDTSAKISDDELEIVIDLGKEYKITDILLKWDIEYAESFNIYAGKELSELKKVVEQSQSTGGTDRFEVDDVSCRYLKLDGFQSAQKKNPQLMELEVFGDELYLEADGQPNADSENISNNENFQILNVLIWACIALIVCTIVVAVLIIIKKIKTVSKN